MSKSSGPLILSVINPDKESGKTSCAIAMAAGLREAGRYPLLIDMTQSCDLTNQLASGGNDFGDRTIFGSILKGRGLGPVVRLSRNGSLPFIPGGSDYHSVEKYFTNIEGYTERVRSLILNTTDDFDAFIIDTPSRICPVSALAMGVSNYFLSPVIPVLESAVVFDEVFKVASLINRYLNPNLAFLGAFLSMCEGRDSNGKILESKIGAAFGNMLLRNKIIRTNNRYDRDELYAEVVREIILRLGV